MRPLWRVDSFCHPKAGLGVYAAYAYAKSERSGGLGMIRNGAANVRRSNYTCHVERGRNISTEFAERWRFLGCLGMTE